MRNHELDRLRIEESRALAELRHAEERMAASERELERRLDDFDADVDSAENTIDDYLRTENGGHEPEHPPYWHARAPKKSGRARRPRP